MNGGGGEGDKKEGGRKEGWNTISPEAVWSSVGKERADRDRPHSEREGGIHLTVRPSVQASVHLAIHPIQRTNLCGRPD